jgi:hypothetical protein
MTPAVEAAVAEIRTAYEGYTVDATVLPDGGACVIVHGLPLSDTFESNVSWVGFVIGFQYPYADVYPHHIDGQIKRRDGAALGEGFSGIQNWQGRSCIQVSRRSNHLDAATDTAALKLAKVLQWLRSL